MQSWLPRARASFGFHSLHINARVKANEAGTQTRRQGRVRSDQGRKNSSTPFNKQETNSRRTYWNRSDFSSHLIYPSRTSAMKDSHQNDICVAGTEIEVKLRIPDSASYEALCEALIPCFKQTHEQENWFFDGAEKELSSQRVVLRLRFYDKDRKAVLTVKGAQVLENGVGIAPEEEENVDPKTARGYLMDPQSLLESPSPLIAKLKSRLGLTKGLISLGGFYNLRKEYKWREYLLEVDQTCYPWGTLHEVECETADPLRLKRELESLLDSHSIPYSNSVKSKFANFVDKTLE